MALVLRRGCPNKHGDKIEDYDIKHPLLELRLTPTTGLGLFAKQDITRGTRILSEAPLFVLPAAPDDTTQLSQELLKLSRHDLDLFHSLQSNKELVDRRLRKKIRHDLSASWKLRQHRPEALHTYVDVEIQTQATFKTNGTPLTPEQGVGIFPLYSRVNHSCTPNSHASYNPSLGQHTVHAIRDIAADEEIFTSYIDAAQPGDRRTAALEAYSVDCYCEICRVGVTGKTSEKRRSRLFEVNSGLAVYGGKSNPNLPETVIPRNPTHALAAAEESITILKQEGLIGMNLATAYRRASKYNLQLGAVGQANEFAKKELEIERCCLGTETEYIHTPGNVEAWMKEIERVAEKDQVKIRMCEKREKKDAKKAERKKAKKKGGR